MPSLWSKLPAGSGTAPWVANNIDPPLTSRGTGVVRTAGNLRVWNRRTKFQFEDASGCIVRTAGTNTMQFAPSGATAQMVLTRCPWLE